MKIMQIIDKLNAGTECGNPLMAHTNLQFFKFASLTCVPEQEPHSVYV